MISDTNEKTEPAPLTEREMNQFVMLAALPTLERALERLRWLEAEVVSLTAQRDEAFKSAINAALRADDHNADPLAEMWRELSEYQPMADADGHGESWARMCQARTEEAASEAYRARQASSHVAAAAYGALWAEQRDAAVRRLSKEAVAWAADAVVAIRRAKEER
jgi:hypothetical protein